MLQDNTYFSAQNIVVRVQQGDYPLVWRIYKRHCGTATILAILFKSLIAPFMVILSSPILFFMILFIGITFHLDITNLVWVFSIVVVLCAALSLLLTAMYRTKQAASRARTLLVLLPDSVIYCHHGIAQNAYALHFSGVASMRLSNRIDISGGGNTSVSSTTVYWLDIETLDGHYIQWNEQIQYVGDPQIIGQTIVAAYNYYKRQYG